MPKQRDDLVMLNHSRHGEWMKEINDALTASLWPFRPGILLGNDHAAAALVRTVRNNGGTYHDSLALLIARGIATNVDQARELINENPYLQ